MTFRMQGIGYAFKPGSLLPVEGLVTFRIISYQHFTEGRVEGFDMFAEILAVLEIKLVLAALFGRTRGRVAFRCRIAKNGSAKLLVYQNAGLLFGYASGEGGLKAVIDYLFGGSNLRCLLVSQFPFPAEQLCLERSTVIEWLDIQRLIISDIHNVLSLSWR